MYPLASWKPTEDLGKWHHTWPSHNEAWRAPISRRETIGRAKGLTRGEADGPHEYVYMKISCVTRKIKPIIRPYLSHLERHHKILETLSAKPSQYGKIPTLKGFQFTIHHYINTRPPLFSSTQKIPSSLTIEFLKVSHSLTWPSEGSWLVPHRCLLFGPIVLILQVPIEVIWSLQLIDDFSTSSKTMLEIWLRSWKISKKKSINVWWNNFHPN